MNKLGYSSIIIKVVGTSDGLNKEQAANKLRAYLVAISERLWEKARELYREYGMDVVNFIVEDISVPEDDPNYRELQKALSTANSEAVKMQRLGYSYQEKRTYDILQDAVQNEGTASDLMGAGMGVGMGLNLGGIFGGAMGGAMQQMNPGMWQGGYPAYGQFMNGMGSPAGQPMNGMGAPAGQPMAGMGAPAGQPAASFCPECGGRIEPGVKFCMNCGAKLAQEQQPVCPSCHSPVAPEARFCMNCGTKLGTE